MRIIKENNATGTFEEYSLEDGFFLLKNLNESEDKVRIVKEIDASYIQFHFNLRGAINFHFNKGNYTLSVDEEKSLLLYNPQQDLPIDLELYPKSSLLSLLIPIKKLHSLFSEDANYIDFLSAEKKDKKYYQEGLISPSMAIVLHQMIHANFHKSVQNLYYKGKIYELMSLYFHRSEDADIEQCPFLVDEENVMKIRSAKEIIISRMAEPPKLQELADEIGLNIKKLKEGFKQIYGDTVFNFLFEHKMEYARKMLESEAFNVNEVGLKVGYSTASHFIAAFKKRYGTTPKKYLMSLTN